MKVREIVCKKLPPKTLARGTHVLTIWSSLLHKYPFPRALALSLLSLHTLFPPHEGYSMRILFLVVLVLALSLQPALAAPKESFETEEYKASWALDIINASQAYALGYTGLGETIGVLDSPVRVTHPELAGKADTIDVAADWEQVTHGTHVAGIIAAKRDGIGMHGVAFDAGIWAGPLLDNPDGLDLEDYFASHPEVRIFNNSWGSITFVDMLDPEAGEEYTPEDYYDDILPQDPDAYFITNYAGDHPETVFVFASGNEGHTSPNFPSATPRYMGQGDLANWINVGALNPHSVQKDGDGKLVLNAASVPFFTNLAKGSELYTVMAPGSNIHSLNAADNGYMPESGTSMAAPVVSGTLALVAQAYPWMTGKQLADSVLTTANSSFDAPEYTVLYDITSRDPENGNPGTVTLVLIADDREEAENIKQNGKKIQIGNTNYDISLNDPNIDAVKALVQAHINLDRDAWIGWWEAALDAVEAAAPEDSREEEGDAAAAESEEGETAEEEETEESEEESLVIEVLTKEEVFGQGILDVGKAVRGPALLDANRMTAENVETVKELESELEGKNTFAIETFDTQGYVAEFSNDISERQWVDEYHHEAYRTTGTDPDMAGDAWALNGMENEEDTAEPLNVGLRKTGAGMLILSGKNDYWGATIVDGGVLAIARQVDGNGDIVEDTGILKKSSVVVRENGVLAGDGEIKQQVINNGIVAPGFRDNTLTVGTYTQGKDGTLLVTYDNTQEHSVLEVKNKAGIEGNLVFAPARGQFYGNNFSVELENFLQVPDAPENANVHFDNYLAEDASPTLETVLVGKPDMDDMSASVVLTRSANAYARYAANSGSADLGRNLPGIASVARGDMQSLLTALDWSARDGHEVGRALDTLGAEAYDASARASLAQQAEFNLLILRRMLGNESARRALKANDNQPDAENWQFWATPYGSGAWQGSHGEVSSWKSSGIGLIVGADRYFESGLSIGAHVALAAKRTHVTGNHDAQADTQSAFVGLQGMFAPDTWDGFWLTAQGRLGIESGEMDREVSFNGYVRNNESRWSGFAGSALLGGGKDWSWKIGDGHLDAGPLAWMEYSFLHRPGIEEHSGQASRLDVDETVYQSLLLSLGAHAGLNTTFANGTTLGLDLLAAWRHETLDATFRTGASFREYEGYDFATATDLPGRDSMLVQSSVRFTHPSNFFVQMDLGGEFFRTDYTAVNVGLQLGWDF